jgi:hypothetical protein
MATTRWRHAEREDYGLADRITILVVPQYQAMADLSPLPLPAYRSTPSAMHYSRHSELASSGQLPPPLIAPTDPIGYKQY